MRLSGALTIALEEGSVADDIGDLEQRVEQVVAARETLAKLARDLAERTPGEKSVILDLLTEALPRLLSAIGALWSYRGEREKATRATIAARLEAARWPTFAELTSG